MLKEIIVFLLGVFFSTCTALPVDKINIAISPNQGSIPIQIPKEVLVPASTMFRKGNWKSGVGLGNYGTGYAALGGLGGLGGYSGYGGYTGYNGYSGYGGHSGGYTGGYAGGYQPGSYGWRT